MSLDPPRRRPWDTSDQARTLDEIIKSFKNMSVENPRGTNENLYKNADYISNVENRETIKRKFQKAIETTLSEFSDKTGDSDFVFERLKIPYQLDPPVVVAMATVLSKKLEYFCISWIPSQKKLTRTMIMVRDEYRGQGIGSAMNSVTETIAKKLGCTNITVEAIVETSIEYWKNKSDYKLDEVSRSATKYF